MRAVLVAGPKYLVSLPKDPGPVEAIVNPCVFKNIWSCLASSLKVAPNGMSLVKMYLFRLIGVGGVFGVGVEGVSVVFEQASPVMILKLNPVKHPGVVGSVV